MNLRRLALTENFDVDAEAYSFSHLFELNKPRRRGLFQFAGKVSMRGRLAALTSIVVIFYIAIITGAAYVTVSAVIRQDLDRNLKVRAQILADDSSLRAAYAEKQANARSVGGFAPGFIEDYSNRKVMVIPAAFAGASTDDESFRNLVGLDTLDVVKGKRPYAFETFHMDRTFALRDRDGSVIIVAQSTYTLTSTLDELALVLFLLAITGSIGALVTSFAVATAGVQPIYRLRRAVERVAETGELRQIPVHTQDELGNLTVAYNDMMSALQLAETKQKNLVADASHELKTPLTSMRTNVELLMQVSEPDPKKIDPAEVKALQNDVIAQINEMSSLIGDLVDLAREDSNTANHSHTTLNLGEVLEAVLERVQRRRLDVTFDMRLVPWELEGDLFTLSRAFMNLMDNAAKWSPQNGVVRVWMDVVNNSDQSMVEICVADSGPGIPEADREKIFDRFYRSIEARSMPGSGLGLAIVKQNIEKHHGLVVADVSDDGGALMRVLLPGRPVQNGQAS